MFFSSFFIKQKDVTKSIASKNRQKTEYCLTGRKKETTLVCPLAVILRIFCILFLYAEFLFPVTLIIHKFGWHASSFLRRMTIMA